MSELTPEERIARLRAQRGQPSAPERHPISSAAARSVLPPPTSTAAPFPPPCGPAGSPSTPAMPVATVVGPALDETPRRTRAILRRTPHPARRARWAIGIAAVGGFVAMLPAMGPLSATADEPPPDPNDAPDPASTVSTPVGTVDATVTLGPLDDHRRRSEHEHTGRLHRARRPRCTTGCGRRRSIARTNHGDEFSVDTGTRTGIESQRRRGACRCCDAGGSGSGSGSCPNPRPRSGSGSCPGSCSVSGPGSCPAACSCPGSCSCSGSGPGPGSCPAACNDSAVVMMTAGARQSAAGFRSMASHGRGQELRRVRGLISPSETWA